MKENLNKVHYENHSVKIEKPHFDSVEIILKDLEERLIEIINENKECAIFGCVAWLTSIPILKALSKSNCVQILVQKEDFLRPDMNNFYKRNIWKDELRFYYDKLKCYPLRYQFKEPINYLSYFSDPSMESIRCVGNHNSNKNPAFPRSHHKFLVFCKIEDKDEFIYNPIAVWTGSFNFTKNATYSFENAVYMVDNSGENKILNSYLKEHHSIFELSEPLNWETDWINPQYEQGT